MHLQYLHLLSLLPYLLRVVGVVATRAGEGWEGECSKFGQDLKGWSLVWTEESRDQAVTLGWHFTSILTRKEERSRKIKLFFFFALLFFCVFVDNNSKNTDHLSFLVLASKYSRL